MFHGASTVCMQGVEKKTNKQKLPPPSFTHTHTHTHTFYFWSIKFLVEIVKAEEFLTYYTAVFIFHSLPVLMGLISVSAMITPQLASITGAWLSSRAKSSFPSSQPPITGPLKSIPCSQLNHMLQVSKCFAPSRRQAPIHQLYPQLWIADLFIYLFIFSFAFPVHKRCV